MKQSVLVSALLAAMMATSAQADTLLGIRAGADYWQASTKGSINTAPNPDYNSSAQGSIWASLEHPIPLIPNVMIRENMLKQDGTSEDKAVKTDLSNTDFILYYEILDNDLVSLDVGGAFKLMHGGFTSHPEKALKKANIDDGVFMGYANAVVGVPGLGLFGFADVLTGLNETKVHDYQVGLGWQFDGTLLDTRVRTGFREFNFNVDNFSGITSTDTKFSGWFAGVELHF